ncbi:hypothetical protein DPMN_155909 [Dreissena polymorpha]|uniref:Uncharacterized protein n=1 Tax=Dreissena polymorpha TaxID=45954 RepID=A0A9D4J726_DREPO|nr:hypothetical protein DPMN_155909 [Dreissena polymorpha]
MRIQTSILGQIDSIYIVLYYTWLESHMLLTGHMLQGPLVSSSILVSMNFLQVSMRQYQEDHQAENPYLWHLPDN